MDPRTRKAISARDGAVARINTLTWRIGAASCAGALVLAAGFAHLLPTHLPTLGIGRQGGGYSNGSDGGLQGPGSGPGQGSGPGHVRSGGS
jgi:hypothetical protein